MKHVVREDSSASLPRVSYPPPPPAPSTSSPAIGGQRRNSGSERYGAVSWRSSSSGGKAGGAVDEMLPWEQNGVGPGGADGENRPLIGDDGLPATAEDKKSPGSYGSWMPRLFK